MRAIGTILLLILVIHGQTQPLDTLVNVGKHNLHFNIIKGQGTPIIFESGAGNDGRVWKDILEPLHDSIGVPLITYDRAGFGKSGLDSLNININTETDDLTKALQSLGYNGHYFLVAHSLGGDYAMVFTTKNKNKVIGAVLVDIVPPGFMTARKAREVRGSFQDSLASIKRQSLGFYYIIQNYETTSEAMRMSAQNIKIPLTVICSDNPPFEGQDSIKWKTSLRDFANASNNRNFILAKGSGHYIFMDDPSLVIHAIIKQYDAVAHPKN